MTTGMQPKKQTIGKQGSTRGVQLLFRAGRPSPYGVMWRERVWDEATKREVVQRKSEFFEHEKDRDARATELAAQRREGRMATASRAEVEEFRAFRAAIGSTPWQDVVAGWRYSMMKDGMTRCEVTVEQAVNKHLLEMKPPEVAKGAKPTPGPVSIDTYRQKKHKLTLFAEQFGSLALDQVSGGEVEDWINDFPEVQSEATFNNYRKHIRTLFQIYVEKGTLRRNPLDDVQKRDDSIDEVGVNQPHEIAKLFAFALGSKKFKVAIGRLALEAFAGLRFSSGCRLEKHEINFADRGILLPKGKIKTGKKTGRRHYIDNLPENLWAWLDATPDECWDLTPRQYLELKSTLFTEADVPHPRNCLRHNFCTYHLRLHQNPGRTATILCHRNQDELWDHYAGIGTHGKGVLYFDITPSTAAQIAAGVVPETQRDGRPPLAASHQTEPARPA